MAENPEAFFTVTTHHAQRIFPSVLVWVLISLTPISITLAFCLLSWISFLATLQLAYWILRGLRVSPGIGFGSVIFLTAHWPIRYALSIPFQACDAFVYPLTLLTAVALLKNKLNWFLFLGVIGVLTRQNLFVLCGTGCCYLLFSRKEYKAFLYGSVFIAVFFVSSYYAGGGAFSSLRHHTVSNFSLDGILLGLLETQVIFLLSPFFFLLLFPQIYKILLEYWWLTLCAMITILQPLTNYLITDLDNTQRISYQGLWLFVLASAIFLNFVVKSRRVVLFYMSLPFIARFLQIVVSRYLMPDPFVMGYFSRQIALNCTSLIVLGIVVYSNFTNESDRHSKLET